MPYTERKLCAPRPSTRKEIAMKAPYFGSVWYASEEKARSLTKWLVFEDRGALQVTPSGMTFTGRAGPLQIDGVRRVSLTRQRMPWFIYLIAAVIIVVFAAVLSELSEVPLWIVLVAAAIGYVWSAGLQAITPWVVVEYTDRHGDVRRAYFADGSALGWGGLFGGTKRMLREMDMYFAQQFVQGAPATG